MHITSVKTQNRFEFCVTLCESVSFPQNVSFPHVLGRTKLDASFSEAEAAAADAAVERGAVLKVRGGRDGLGVVAKPDAHFESRDAPCVDHAGAENVLHLPSNVAGQRQPFVDVHGLFGGQQAPSALYHRMHIAVQQPQRRRRNRKAVQLLAQPLEIRLSQRQGPHTLQHRRFEACGILARSILARNIEARRILARR